jgi:hypothetical protein
MLMAVVAVMWPLEGKGEEEAAAKSVVQAVAG